MAGGWQRRGARIGSSASGGGCQLTDAEPRLTAESCTASRRVTWCLTLQQPFTRTGCHTHSGVSPPASDQVWLHPPTEAVAGCDGEETGRWGVRVRVRLEDLVSFSVFVFVFFLFRVIVTPQCGKCNRSLSSFESLQGPFICTALFVVAICEIRNTSQCVSIKVSIMYSVFWFSAYE